MTEIYKELYVCDNCNIVELEIYTGSICQDCGKGTLICTYFVPESQLTTQSETIRKLREALEDLEKWVTELNPNIEGDIDAILEPARAILAETEQK